MIRSAESKNTSGFSFRAAASAAGGTWLKDTACIGEETCVTVLDRVFELNLGSLQLSLKDTVRQAAGG